MKIHHLTEAGALKLASRISAAISEVARLMTQAQAGDAYRALDYASWNDFCDAVGISAQTETLNDRTHLTDAEWRDVQDFWRRRRESEAYHEAKRKRLEATCSTAPLSPVRSTIATTSKQ
jgi:hypothetical protein